MWSFKGLRRHRLSHGRITLTGAAVIFVTISAAGVAIWDLRQDAINTYQQEMRNLGVASAEQTARTLQAVDIALHEVAEKARGVAADTPEQFQSLLATEDTQRFLADRLKNLPQADLIALIAANGTLINSSRGWPVSAFEPFRPRLPGARPVAQRFDSLY
jgi:hypothetical protein